MGKFDWLMGDDVIEDVVLLLPAMTVTFTSSGDRTGAFLTAFSLLSESGDLCSACDVVLLFFSWLSITCFPFSDSWPLFLSTTFTLGSDDPFLLLFHFMRRFWNHIFTWNQNE